MLKGIFFDLYGTLLVYQNIDLAWKDWLTTFYNSACSYGLKINKSSFKKECNGFFSKPAPLSIEEDFSTFEQRVANQCEDLGLILANSEIKNIATACVTSWQKYVKLDPFAIEILKILKKRHALALITNFDHPPHIYSLLSQEKILQYFDSIVISAEVGIRKPNPLIFDYALEDTSLNLNEIIFIGDSYDDFWAARNAGIPFILIQRDNSEDQLITDYYADSSGKINEAVRENVRKIPSLNQLIASLNEFENNI